MALRFPPPYGYCEHLRQTVGIEETSNPLKASVDIAYGFLLSGRCYWDIFANASNPDGTLEMANSFLTNDFRVFFGHLDTRDAWIALAFTLVWTIARYLLVGFVFRPSARWLGVHKKKVEKLCESAWKAIAYSVMWSSAFYAVFCSSYNFFQEPMQQFSDWTMERPAPLDLALVYALEFSFYLHSIYATLFMDAWRKDSLVMIAHHFITMILVSFSYIIRCLKIGVLIFCLNDISDVLLESGKVATYLRHRSSGFSRFFSTISDITAALFALSWFVNRLIFHMTKVWRAGALGIWVSHPLLPLPFHVFLSVFLGTLYFFYLYWFYYIAIFVVRVLREKPGEAEDPREDEKNTLKKQA